MAEKSENIEINCPCCGAIVVIDPETRAILRFEELKKPTASFGELLKEVGESKKKSASKLKRALEEQRQRGEILDKKFKEAMRKAEETEEPPPRNPMDLD